MTRFVLLDTGPLVASLNRRDKYHVWAKAKLAEIAPPMHTCEAVLAEACFLLQEAPGASAAIIELLHRGMLKTDFRAGDHAAPLAKLMTKYQDIPMSFADACLVRMSELDNRHSILTLDTDFRVYRRNGRTAIPLIIPLEK